MTRKTALLQAISILSQTKGNKEITTLLSDIAEELPMVHWSDKSIRDTIDQFILDNDGRVPTVTDFKKKGMPPHTVIKQKYGISLGEWLKENYPTDKPTLSILKERYTTEFIKDYEKIKPRSQYEFNNNRTKGTKGWQTVAHYNEVTSWRNLLKKLNLKFYFEMQKDRVKPVFQINITTDFKEM